MIYLVEKWKIALKEFLSKYEDDDDVVGAILCGSYATGNQNEYSDIDVQLVLKDTCDYSVHGVTESNSYLIEFFINPAYKIKEYMELNYKKNRQMTQNMFAYGKIIYDLDGSVKQLQDLALEYIDRPFEVISGKKMDMNNYHVWDYLDELKVSLKESSPSFNLIYYKLLDGLYESYCELQGIPKLPISRIYKILTDEDFRKKCHIFKIPEKEFIKLYVKCFEIDKPDKMYKNIEELIDYYYKRQGGFNIRQFKLRTELKEEEL